jgi:hypothetical protein
MPTEGGGFSLQKGACTLAGHIAGGHLSNKHVTSRFISARVRTMQNKEFIR